MARTSKNIKNKTAKSLRKTKKATRKYGGYNLKNKIKRFFKNPNKYPSMKNPNPSMKNPNRSEHRIVDNRHRHTNTPTSN